MKELITGILFSIAAIIAFVMSGFFFSQTGITLNSFLTSNTIPLINALISFNFLFFCISAALGTGILISMGSFYEFKKASMFGGIAYIISILVVIVMFNLFDFFAPLALGLFAIPICYISIQKARELKVFPILRAGTYSAGKFVLILGAALFLVLLFNSVYNADALRDNFTRDLLLTTVGGNITLSDQISLQLANAISAQQSATIDNILNQEEMTNLVNSGSSDALMLNQKLLAYKAAYSGEEYKTNLAQSFKNQNIDLGTELIGKFPILNTLAQYAYIIYPLSAFLLFIFIGNILIGPLAGLVFAAIVKLSLPIQETEKKA